MSLAACAPRTARVSARPRSGWCVRPVPKVLSTDRTLPHSGHRSLIGQPQIMDISIAMTFRTGNGSCGGWSYSVWVLCST
jgi:hypothetical protein